MQKNIIALAIAAAFAAPVTAMADAALFGTFDAGIRVKSFNGANGTNTTNTSGAVTSSQSGVATTSMDMRGLYASNAWGFKASEDLGNGMKAGVHFEADFVPNAATTTYQGQLFDREMSASLSGGFGAVKLGYQYTPSFLSNKRYDPMGYAFVTSLYSSTLGNAVANRGYSADYTNKFGDISVQAQYIMNNQDTATNNVATTGQGRSVAVDYAAGPISVGGSYTTHDSDVRTGTAAPNAITNMTVGAGFNFGDGNVKVGYAKKTTGAGGLAAGNLSNDATSTTMWLGADYKVSDKIGAAIGYYKNTANAGNAGTGSVSAAAVDVNKSMVIGMVTYALSKKTTAYFGAERESADVAATTANSTATGATAGTFLAADAQVTSSYSVGMAVKF